MINSQNIAVAVWAFFIFYWVLNWHKVKPTQETYWAQGSLGRIAIVVAILFIFFSHFSLFPSVHFPKVALPYYSRIIGDILAVAGLAIAIVARNTLSYNWSAGVDLKNDHELITKGIYSYMRHPIYTGFFLMVLGTLLAFQTVLVLAIFLIIIVIFGLKIVEEEKLLAKHFPKNYPAYKKKVKALIPFIF